jgi:phytoene synthase
MKLFTQNTGSPAPASEGPQAPAPVSHLQLQTAYAVCRGITRAAARNFYYAFLVLPAEKRNALSAVYAFMRHADDICDGPDMPIAGRRAKLDAWLAGLQRVLAGQPTDDPVLMALAHTQHQYAIPPALLESLVEGTAMDLDPAATYATFDDLYRYCYHVASVVGLVCIKIFGYRDPAAEPLAERVGIGFQLTNIIRDVKEDAAMGRVYLPREDLDRFGCNASELNSGQPDLAVRFRPLLEFETRRAREYYRAARELLPLIDEQSRPALWVLVEIYRRLLEKIALRNYDVFSDKVRLTTAEKLAVLARGFWRRMA